MRPADVVVVAVRVVADDNDGSHRKMGQAK